MTSVENLVAGLHDELVACFIESSARMVGVRRGFLENAVGCNHFAWNQIVTDAEVLERALRLRPPQFVAGT